MLIREEKRREETGRLNEKEATCLEKQSGAGQASGGDYNYSDRIAGLNYQFKHRVHVLITYQVCQLYLPTIKVA